MRKLTAIILSVIACVASSSRAGEPVALDSLSSPFAIAPDEPLAQEFSLERAASYLDRAAGDWQATHACTACHTMLPCMVARPALDSVLPQPPAVRQFFEEVVAGKREAMPDYACDDVDGAVAIGVAWAMALNDRWSTGRLHPLTRQALDHMWTVQRADGGWPWPFRDTPPLKIDELYGATLAAIAVGMAPGDYADTPQAKAGLEGIRRFLHESKTSILHQKVMLLWAAAYVDDVLSEETKAQFLAELLRAKRPDGGWSMANLVDNANDPSLDANRVAKSKAKAGYSNEHLIYFGRDNDYPSSLASDGYATGLAIFVARQAGLSASDPRLQQGIAWLKTNQRESGRWFTPSQGAHTRHYISNAGTAYAILALQACGEVPSSP